MSTTTVTSADPAATRYQCGSGCGTLTFSWGRRMPENGRLGSASLGQFVNKPIQVYDAKEVRDGYGNLLYTDWGFQAQDGSFLGRMLVSARQSHIRFVRFRANDQWPQVTCSVPRPDPDDSRDPIDKVV